MKMLVMLIVVLVLWMLVFVIVGCAARITQTVEWGEKLNGGIEMKINEEKEEENNGGTI